MGTLEMSEKEIKDMAIGMLTREYNYPLTNIETEVPKSLGNARFTADIVVYVNNKPHILIEVKNTKFNLIRGKSQLERITQAIKPNYSVITNGIDFSFYKVQKDSYTIELIEVPDIPRYQETSDNMASIYQEELIELSSNRFLTMMWRHFDILRTEAYPTFDSFKYLLLLYATKYRDEVTNQYHFKAENDPERTKNKILGLVNDVLSSNRELENVIIPFTAQSIQYITLDIQKVALSKSTEEFSKTIPTIIQRFGRHLESYTNPEIIAELIVDVLDPRPNNEFLDPACGLGGFLVKAAQRGARIEGIELSRETSHLANLILMLSGCEGQVHWGNSLNEVETHVGQYDYVAVSPPFRQIITKELWNYQLFNPNAKTFSEELFLEASLKYLKSHGVCAILVPYGFLFHSGYAKGRQFLLKNSALKAIIKITPDLYSNWFKVTSSLIIYEKDREGTSPDDRVFFGQLTENNYRELVQKYRNYIDGIPFENSETVFVSNIKSDENLDIDYIRGSQFLDTLDSSEYIDLRRLVDIISGTSVERVGEKSEHGDYHYIQASNIGEGAVDTSQADLITVKDVKSKYIAQPNDILLSRAGTVGKVAIVRDENRIVAGSNVVILRVKDERTTPEFILGFFLSNFGKRQLEMYTTGTTINHINRTNLGKLRIPLLEKTAQNQVVRSLNNLVALKKEEEKLIVDLRKKQQQVLDQLDATFQEAQ